MSFAGRVGARITAPVCSRPEPGQLAALVSADSIASVGVWRGRSHRVQSTPEGAMSYAMGVDVRSEEHTSELQSLMRISYAVFCLKKKQSRHTNKRVNYTHKHLRK